MGHSSINAYGYLLRHFFPYAQAYGASFLFSARRDSMAYREESRGICKLLQDPGRGQSKAGLEKDGNEISP